MPEEATVPAERDDVAAIQAVLDRIRRAWQLKEFDDLDECFDEDAVITGPGHALYATGRSACAESYREFARNAAVLEYSESGHQLRRWDRVAVHTFSWKMTYQRDRGAKVEEGTDQLVLECRADEWRVVYRHIFFSPSPTDS
jgi:uncharacterized protein (TIGR02246 family)